MPRSFFAPRGRRSNRSSRTTHEAETAALINPFPFDKFPNCIKLEVFTWAINGATYDAVNDEIYPSSPFGSDVSEVSLLCHTPTILASVSSSWRDIMLTFGSLWCTVTVPVLGTDSIHEMVHLLKNVTRHIEYSRQHKLHIILILSNIPRNLVQSDSPLWPIIALIWAQSPRWKSCTIVGDSSQVQFWDGVTIPQGTTSLTRLTLDASTTTRWLSAVQSPLDQCQSLSVILHDFCIPVGASATFSNVKDVDMVLLNRRTYHETNATTMLNAFKLLAFVPNVQRLTMRINDIDKARPEQWTWKTVKLVEHKIRIELRRLQVWHLLGCDRPRAYDSSYFDFESFLPIVHAPALTNLLIQQPSPRTLIQFLNASQCKLEFLGICIHPNVPIYKLGKNLVSLTDSVQGLRTLALYARGPHRSTVLVRELCDKADLLPFLEDITLHVVSNTITKQTSATPPIGFDFSDNIIPLFDCRKGTLKKISAHITTTAEERNAVKEVILNSGISGVSWLHDGSKWSKLDTRRGKREFVEEAGDNPDDQAIDNGHSSVFEDSD